VTSLDALLSKASRPVDGQKGRRSFYTIAYLRTRCAADENQCWVWQGARQSNGYGVVGRNQTGTRMIHRVMYILTFGMISHEVEIDHLCRNRACANPEHMELVTHAENCRRGIAYHERPTHCKHGHAYTPENTYITPTGYYVCQTCMGRPPRINTNLAALFPDSVKES
jgi:hypothetical protein